MKRFLVLLLLLATGAPLFANDEGGDVAYIPSYRELVHEGYGPRVDIRRDGYRGEYSLKAAPKPTQAYYAKGYTIYYGYTPVPSRRPDPNLLYAFGYPVDYFRQLMPTSITETNLNRYAVVLTNPSNPYGPGEFIARSQNVHGNATTTVQSTKAATAPANGTAPLPAIGEKLAR